jgi:large subunit ribosomal protein L17
MHRHGYQGRKLRRERDQRRALLKGLATQLVEHGSITTTLPRAKELVPYVEVLVTKAKRGDLHNRRQVISDLTTTEAAHKLVDEIAPQLSKRNGGYLRIKKAGSRVGDNAGLAKVSFVDELKPVEAAEPEIKPATKPAAKKPAKKEA